jgi:hypothetical protein
VRVPPLFEGTPRAVPDTYARLAEGYTIGSEEEEKTAPHLSCEINGVQCKALCDIGAQVSVLSSKIYNKVQDHNLDLAQHQRNQSWEMVELLDL